MKKCDQILEYVTKEVYKQENFKPDPKKIIKVYVAYKNDHNFQEDEMDEIFKAVEAINKVGLFECTYNATYMEFHLKRIAN